MLVSIEHGCQLRYIEFVFVKDFIDYHSSTMWTANFDLQGILST